MRPLAIFFTLGALLLLAKRAVVSVLAVPSITVEVGASASAAEVERAIDEAVLLEHALAAGGALIDPVVREQLLSAMRTDEARADDPDTEEARLSRAIALGVHRADPVVRQRLAFQAEQLLMASAAVEAPTDDALARYVAAHAERYGKPPRISLEQVFLRRSRGAEQLRGRLPDGPVEPAVLAALGDPTLLPVRVAHALPRELDARFGPGFAANLARAAPGRWAGPVRSSFGSHFVRIVERRASAPPDLARVRARALADYQHDRRAEVLRGRLRELRASYRVRVERLRS